MRSCDGERSNLNISNIIPMRSNTYIQQHDPDSASESHETN